MDADGTNYVLVKSNEKAQPPGLGFGCVFSFFQTKDEMSLVRLS